MSENKSVNIDLFFISIVRWLYLVLAVLFFLLLAKNLGWLKI